MFIIILNLVIIIILIIYLFINQIINLINFTNHPHEVINFFQFSLVFAITLLMFTNLYQ